LFFCRFFLLQFLALRTGRNDACHYAKRAAAKQVFPTTGGADILRTTPLHRGITGFCDSRFFLLPAVITVKAPPPSSGIHSGMPNAHGLLSFMVARSPVGA